MSTRLLAQSWLQKNHPSEIFNTMSASRHHSARDLWFFTFPSSYFDNRREGALIVLCQSPLDCAQFYCLKVPFQFFLQQKSRFDIRVTGDKFDLHLSAKRHNWLVDERSGIAFADFEVT